MMVKYRFTLGWADSTLAGLSVFSEYTQYSINNNTVTYDNTVSDVESLIIDTMRILILDSILGH